MDSVTVPEPLRRGGRVDARHDRLADGPVIEQGRGEAAGEVDTKLVKVAVFKE